MFKLPSFSLYAKAKKVPFRLLATQPGYFAWGGFLPNTPLCRHFLYTVSLSGDGPRPLPRFVGATHEIRIGYRLIFGSRPLSLLYTAQYNFGDHKEKAEWVADRITLSIAMEMRDLATDRKVLLRADPEYWDWFINHEYRNFTNAGSSYEKSIVGLAIDGK